MQRWDVAWVSNRLVASPDAGRCPGKLYNEDRCSQLLGTLADRQRTLVCTSGLPNPDSVADELIGAESSTGAARSWYRSTREDMNSDVALAVVQVASSAPLRGAV